MKTELMGLKINTETRTEILAIINGRLEAGKKTFITTPYSEFFYHAATNYSFRQAVNDSDIAIPDGVSVMWLAYYLSMPLTLKDYYVKILEAFWQLVYTGSQILISPAKLKKVIPEKIPGSDFFWDLARLASQQKQKIFILGGYGMVPNIVAEKITLNFPEIQIAGVSNAGPEDSNIIKTINDSGADFLFVAYGPVKQELWIYKNLSALNIKLAIGLGGTFDYVAGTKLPPPKFIRKTGLEWLYRLITQPSRFKRIWHATFDVSRGALRTKVFMSLPFRHNVVAVILNKDNKVFVATRVLASNIQDVNAERPLNTDQEHWQFPQGGVEPGENEEQAVLRESAEETGLTNLKILGKASQTYSYIWPHMFRKLISNQRPYKGQQQSIYYLRCLDENTQTVFHSEEFNHYKWVDINELPQILHPVRLEMLKIALNEINDYLAL